MFISANSPLAVRPSTPAASEPPARAKAAAVDTYEGPSRPAEDPKPTEPKDPDTEPTIEDAKAHLQQAAEEAGRFLLAPIDAAMKTVAFAKYYASLLKRAVVDTGVAIKEFVEVGEKEAAQRK